MIKYVFILLVSEQDYISTITTNVIWREEQPFELNCQRILHTSRVHKSSVVLFLYLSKLGFCLPR